MKFSAATLGAVLQAQLPGGASGLVVAVSGGMDSACLLNALVRWRAEVGSTATERGRFSIRAVHVNHGLQPAAADFARACGELCDELGIPLEILVVEVDSTGGVSIEAAARDARYRALERNLGSGECLLTAHHAMDQAETLLLQLLRGAGLKGMSAMPACRPFGKGWHLRPLLDVAKPELRAFGETAGVVAARHAVNDPMNLDPRFDRVYLREQLWPAIERRWPGAAAALSRTARHVADAQGLLDQSAAVLVQKLRDGDALSVSGLRTLPATQRLNALRHWIASRAVTPPSTARLQEAVRQIVEADQDRRPAVIWGGHALRRYRDRLFLTAAAVPRFGDLREWSVDPAACLELGDGLGTLRWSPRLGGLDEGRLPRVLRVRQRQGGETLRPGASAKTQSVQHLCQSMGVLPWMRDALPLLYAGESLVAVGDLWRDARWCVAGTAPGLACVWENAPIIV
jgi:tRNA(Ile)-lysidine synthase